MSSNAHSVPLFKLILKADLQKYNSGEVKPMEFHTRKSAKLHCKRTVGKSWIIIHPTGFKEIFDH